jgi:hypothetical protein
MRFTQAVRKALTGSYLRRALVVMFVVGSILNFINQGDALMHGEPLNAAKLVLTYLVPFCVTTYGAASALVAPRPDENPKN